MGQHSAWPPSGGQAGSLTSAMAAAISANAAQETQPPGLRRVFASSEPVGRYDVEAMFDQARKQMGPLTALVNNAGIFGEKARIDEQHTDEPTRLMQVNVVGSMACAKHDITVSGGV